MQPFIRGIHDILAITSPGICPLFFGFRFPMYGQNGEIMQNPTRKLRVAEATGLEHTVDAPPILVASSHTIDFLCGNCGTVLMHAEDDQVHGLFIHCTQCGACNATVD
jgi:predicted RNA-binding Zn-ribbon protein involved in translation (DUF1610 family)